MIEAGQIKKSIFYISGRNGDFTTGLGEYLATKTEELNGLSLSDKFLSEEFETQLEVISELLSKARAKQSIIVANSYGAYLLLHAILANRIGLSKLILISPILGATYSGNRFFKPPFSRRLHALMGETANGLVGDTIVTWGAEDDSVDQVGLQRLTSRCADTQIIKINEQKHNIDKRILAEALNLILDEFT